MSRATFWSRQWKSWNQTKTRRPRAQRRTAARLEALEQRLNLAAVLVVETIDAYWFIDEASLAPAASADELWGGELSGSAGVDDIGLGLPKSVSPTASNGGTLTAAQAGLTDSLLAELWITEPDFFYEDVLAVTFYSDASMDALIDSGLYDGSSSADSFSNSDLLAGDVLGNADFASNNAGFTTDDQQGLFIDPLTVANKSNESRSAVALNRNDTESLDVFAAARAEVASWSQRLEAESLMQVSGSRAVADDAWAAVIGQSRNIAASNTSTEVLPPSSRDDALRASALSLAVSATNSSQETVAVREATKLESFIAKFPSLGFGGSRSSLLRFVRGSEGAHAANVSEGDDPTTDDANDSLSYSQWASLFGAVSLFGASQWQTGNSDRREKPVTPFRAKDSGKRPVAR